MHENESLIIASVANISGVRDVLNLYAAVWCPQVSGNIDNENKTV